MAAAQGEARKLSEGSWAKTLLSSSNSVRKSQPALPISKIDERLEQYTQAVEVGTGTLTFC